MSGGSLPVRRDGDPRAPRPARSPRVGQHHRPVVQHESRRVREVLATIRAAEVGTARGVAAGDLGVGPEGGAVGLELLPGAVWREGGGDVDRLRDDVAVWQQRSASDKRRGDKPLLDSRGPMEWCSQLHLPALQMFAAPPWCASVPANAPAQSASELQEPPPWKCEPSVSVLLSLGQQLVRSLAGHSRPLKNSR